MGRDIDSLLCQQAALAVFGSFAFQEDDLMRILSEAARICAESMGVQFCKICRYREPENDLLVEAGSGWHAGVAGEVVSRADDSSPQGRAFITGKPVIVRNLKEANGYKPPLFYAEHDIVSTADVLIKARAGTPFGVLEIDSSEQHTYDEHDINFLTGFANVLAEAVATSNRNQLLRETLASMQVLFAEKSRPGAQQPAAFTCLCRTRRGDPGELAARRRPGPGVLVISDDGTGYSADPETRRHGVGLARRLMQQIDGTLEVEAAAPTTWTMRFPVTVATLPEAV